MKERKQNNFDANATYGVDSQCLQMAIELTADCLNPSSIHAGGQKARTLLEDARDQLRAFLKVPAKSQVVFTSGATEANNLALNQAIRRDSDRRKLLISNQEHPSIIEYARFLEAERNLNLFFLNLAKDLKSQLDFHLTQPGEFLISVMAANNETGQVFPIDVIANQIRQHKPRSLIHTDFVQYLTKSDSALELSEIDLISISGHKLGAVSGIGALVAKAGLTPRPIVYGGAQELHSRAGTENLLGIVNLGLVSEKLRQQQDARFELMRSQRDLFEKELQSRSSVEILCVNEDRIANTSCLRFKGVRGDDLIVAMDLAGYCISSGSACASGKPDPSHVIMAMGFSEKEAKEFVRISFRHDAETSEILEFVDTLVNYASKVEKNKQAA